MSADSQAPASAPRMVQVPAEELKTVLLEIQRWEHARAWGDSDDLNEAEEGLEVAQCTLAELLVPGPHHDSPLPALTTPAPQPGEVGAVLELLINYLETRNAAIKGTSAEAALHGGNQAVGLLDQIRRLDPVWLRALVAPQPPAPSMTIDEFIALEGPNWRGITNAVDYVRAQREGAEAPAPAEATRTRLIYLLACIHDEAQRGLADTVNPHAFLRRVKALSDPDIGEYTAPAEAGLREGLKNVLAALDELERQLLPGALIRGERLTPESVAYHAPKVAAARALLSPAAPGAEAGAGGEG